tara:strand:+ start:1168 stop:2574 length:1407 start_codon:yes stop_codon:yes gene_type:complete
MKRIAWSIAIIIIPAFVLGSIFSYINSKKNSAIGAIDGNKITADDYRYFIKLAQLHIRLNANPEKSLSAGDLEQLAMDFMLLRKKADSERIAVTDKDVIEYIQRHPVTKIFFSSGEFDQTAYESFLVRVSNYNQLALTPRSFEEYVRDFVKIERLFINHISINITDDQAKELYLKDIEEAKIAYLSIPYKKFAVEVGISPKELEDFYTQNQPKFAVEAKVKFKYALIANEEEKRNELLGNLNTINTMAELEKAMDLTVKETDLIALTDPIEDIGWQPQINIMAFALPDKTLSQVIETDKGLIILEKIDSQEQYTPALAEIEKEVHQAYILNNAKKDSELFASEIIEKIEASPEKEFKTFANSKDIEYKETEKFKYYDYIEGLGLDENISKIVFSLEDNQVHSKPLLLDTSAYIVKLLEKTPFDDKDFQEKKPAYVAFLTQRIQYKERIDFITNIRQTANLELYPYDEQ